MVLLDDFTVKTALQRLIKRKREMNLIWRAYFKNPMAIWAFEGKLGRNHGTHPPHSNMRFKVKN